MEGGGGGGDKLISASLVYRESSTERVWKPNKQTKKIKMCFSYNSETNLRTKENYLNDPVATYGTNKGICTFSFNCSFTSRITANSIRLLHFCRHEDQLGVCPLWTTNPTSLLPAASPLPISGPSLTIPPIFLMWVLPHLHFSLTTTNPHGPHVLSTQFHCTSILLPSNQALVPWGTTQHVPTTIQPQIERSWKPSPTLHFPIQSFAKLKTSYFQLFPFLVNLWRTSSSHITFL